MKKLIIICEEKLQRYGDFLSQLISGTDDVDGKIIGVKDGAVAAQVWTEKEYVDNAAQISSEQFLLFIGNSKLIKDKRYHMRKAFSEYGMNYAWLGKQAVMFVDRSITGVEYEEFYQFVLDKVVEGDRREIVKLLPERIGSDEQQDNDSAPESSDAEKPTEEKGFLDDLSNLGGKAIEGIQDILDKTDIDDKAIELGRRTKLALEAAAESFKDDPTDSEDEDMAPREGNALQEAKSGNLFLSALGFAKDAIMKTAEQGKKAIDAVSDNINAVMKGKDIQEQQYTCLALLFYLNDLGNFLGISEG